jgi:outer membrane lipoprotein
MRTLLIASLLFLSACASAPFDLTGVDTTLTPDDAMNNPPTLQGRRVMWGGMIVNTRNLQNTTEIEVLGYPLSSTGVVQNDRPAQRRFLLVKDGYLESADYSRGRYVTAVGTINGTRPGKVDEAPYVYPVLNAERLHLWPPEQARKTEPNVGFHFGIGVIFR